MTTVQFEPAKERFIAIPEGGSSDNPALLQYRIDEDAKTIDLIHTFTPPAARGQGLAESLCDQAFDWAYTKGYQVIPSCTYISGRYLDKHPERRHQTTGPQAAHPPEVQHDAPASKFTLTPPGFGPENAAYIDYVRGRDGTLDIQHTVTPVAARGQGFAGRLADAAFDYAKQEGLRVIPTCPYISKTYLDKNPDRRGQTEVQTASTAGSVQDDESSSSGEPDRDHHNNHFYHLAAQQYEQVLASDPSNITILRRAAQLRERRCSEVGDQPDVVLTLRTEARDLLNRALASAREQDDLLPETVQALEELVLAANDNLKQAVEVKDGGDPKRARHV